MAILNKYMFREYDIRGRIDKDDELTPEAIDAIGRGFAVFLKKRGLNEAIVGHDARPYSKTVKDITIKALLESGINVIEIGEVLVPIFYFSQYHLKKKGGVMITASHNPWGWSGFKHAYDYSTTLVPDDVRELYEIVKKGELMSGNGKLEVYSDIINYYKKDITPIYGPSVIEPKHTRADISKAKELLNWEPKVKFQEGLAETCGYFNKIY